MNSILIIGAGRSSGALISYVLDMADKRGWFVTVADVDPKLAEQKVANHPQGRPAWLDVTKTNDRRDLISRADVVVTLLPAHLHLEVAHDCIKLKKRLITSSYVTKELYRLGDEARDRELIFMGEMGLDPGLDHMSAMRVIQRLKAKGAKIESFKSFSGGLIATGSDDNPWNYKFTWNPRNVVLAGQGTAQYLKNGKLKFIPYNRLFEEYEVFDFPGLGEFEAFLNRDSLLYSDVYGLGDIPNVVRGTIRRRGFCDAWNALIKIGLTDGSFPILNAGKMTYHELMESYVRPELTSGSVKERVAQMIGENSDSPIIKKLEWLGLFRKKKINLPFATPALILEKLLLNKWQLKSRDKDLILMFHEFIYKLDGQKRRTTCSLVLKGDNKQQTAIAKLIGLPMGILVRMLMEDKITSKGVHIPVMKDIYEPVLEELEQYGLRFVEQDEAIS